MWSLLIKNIMPQNELTHVDELNKLVSDNARAVVTVYANWDRKIVPIMEQQSDIHKHTAFGKMNARYVGDAVEKYDFTDIPTVMIFKNGQKIDQLRDFQLRGDEGLANIQSKLSSLQKSE